MSSMHSPMCGNQSLTSMPHLPYFLKPDLQWEELVALLAVGVVDDDDAGQLQLLGVLHVLEGRLVDRLAGVFVEHRLGVETLQWQTPPFMNSQMTLFAFGGEMRFAIGRRPCSRYGGARRFALRGASHREPVP